MTITTITLYTLVGSLAFLKLGLMALAVVLLAKTLFSKKNLFPTRALQAIKPALNNPMLMLPHKHH